MNNQKSYQTKQKNVIKDLLIKEGDKHFTAEQILTILEEQDTPVSKATLYRTLEQLVENHEVVKYNFDGTSSCYQYLNCEHNSGRHFHFKCEECGKILHIDNETEAFDLELEKRYGIAIDLSKTILYGICDNCKGGNR